MNATSELRAAVAAAARQIAKAGLVEGTSGNVSARQEGHVAITATGAALETIAAEEITLVDLKGQVIEGDFAPTSELDLHLGIYEAFGAGAVVHCHAPYATAASCVLDELPVLHYEQIALGGEIRVAPFAVFGTPALAAHVHEALQDRKAALMANHGAVAHGRDLNSAVKNALLLEWMCRLYANAQTMGTPRPLSIAQQGDVIEQALKTGYGSTKKV